MVSWGNWIGSDSMWAKFPGSFPNYLLQDVGGGEGEGEVEGERKQGLAFHKWQKTSKIYT